VRGSRNGGNAIYASLYNYAMATFLEAGVLTVNNGSASGPGGPPNAVVNISAGVPSGSIFTRWTLVAGNGTIANPLAANTTFTMSSGGAMVQAEYANNFVLTVSNGSPATATGLPGTPIQITAASRTEPFIGWTFDSSGVEVGAFQNRSSAQTIFTLGNNSASIRANYANTAQNLRVNGGSPAAVQGVPGSTTTTPISAGVPQLGEHFDHWAFVGVPHGTISEPNNPTTHFTFGLGDAWIEARWAAGYSLTVLHGTSDLAGGSAGQTINISAAQPVSGLVFDQWMLVSGSGTFSNAGQPSASFTIGAGDAVIEATYRVAVNAPVVTGGTISGTAGVALSYQVSATNNPTSYAIQSSTLPPGISLNSTTGVISGTPTAAGTFGVAIIATNAGGTAFATFIFVIAPAAQATPPTINQQPLNTTATTGVPVTFSVLATSDTPISYQWNKNGAEIPGATNASYTIQSPVAASAGGYYVVVANSGGSVTSSVASLYVVGPPTPGDSDGDGVSDVVEIALGLDPNNPADVTIQVYTYDALGRLKKGPGGEYIKDSEGNIKEVRP
jgi:hypothetical protein